VAAAQGAAADDKPGAAKLADGADTPAKQQTEPAKEQAQAAKADSGRDAAGADASAEKTSTGAGQESGETPLDDEVMIVSGMPRYHRRGCILIRFLKEEDLEILTRRAAVDANCVPCKACQPDKPGTDD
jgi:hypothetical protein